MTGKLDEISRVIGQQEANLSTLTRTFEKHCEDDDTRHTENVGTLREILKEQRKLNEAIAPLAASVSFMRPIVDGYQIRNWKAIGALSFASILLTGIGAVLWLIFSKAIEWAGAHFRI